MILKWDSVQYQYLDESISVTRHYRHYLSSLLEEQVCEEELHGLTLDKHIII